MGQIKKETGTVWEYIVGNNVNIAKCVCSQKKRINLCLFAKIIWKVQNLVYLTFVIICACFSLKFGKYYFTCEILKTHLCLAQADDRLVIKKNCLDLRNGKLHISTNGHEVVSLCQAQASHFI